MIGATVCTGIGSPETAAPWIDWRWGAEIDKHASTVLAARHPNIRNLGDMTRITADEAEAIDIIVAGTPCQDFSVAGLRAGLDGARGYLTLEFVRLLGQLRPRWFVLENVPGLLSMDEGRAFGFILGEVAELGYGFAYRVLDAQYAGVPQRRERVFVVGHLGDWRPPAAVLFERESLRRDPPPSREAGERVARPIASCLEGSSGYRNDADTADNLIAAYQCQGSNVGEAGTLRAGNGHLTGGVPFVAGTLNSSIGRGTGGAHETDFLVTPLLTHNPYGDHESREGLLIAHSLRAEGFDASEDGTGRGTPLVAYALGSHAGAADGDQTNRSHDAGGPVGSNISEELAYSLREGRTQAIAFTAKDHGADASDIAPTLRAMEFDKSHANGGGQIAVAIQEDNQNGVVLHDTAGSLRANAPGSQPCGTLALTSAVRRLTPRECERLQGFPDDYTLVPYGKKPMADGPRYRMLGNAMAVPVIGWILARVAMVDRHMRSEAA